MGDNSRVAALVDAAGFGPAGTFSLALATEVPPYGVTINVRTSDKPFESVDFGRSATLLLGLVANLDHVRVVSGGRSYALSAAGASTTLGYDVKDLGRDQGKLKAYLDSLRD